jgi:hypothetical protein
MANCNAGGKCHISCSGGCGCVFIHSGEDGVQGECRCECYDIDNSTGKVKVSIGDVVKYIPIRRYKLILSLRSRNSTVSEIVKSSGFILKR